MSEKSFSKGEAIRFGWKTMNDNLGFFIVLTLIILGVNWIPSIISESIKETMPLFSGLVSLGGSLLSVFIGLGMMKIYLKFADGQQGSFEDLISLPHLFLRYLGASILCGLAIFGGFICLIIPGLILAVKLQFFGYFIIDKDERAIESLKRSFAMTKGLWGELFVFSFLLALINFVGLLCLGIGLFATIPTTYIAVAYVYRKLVSQFEVDASPAVQII